MREAIRLALSASAWAPYFVFGKPPKYFHKLRKNDPEGALLRFFQVLFPKVCSLGVSRGNALIGSCVGGSKVSLKTSEVCTQMCRKCVGNVSD